MMDTLIIRRAGSEDAGGIAKVHVETWQYAYRGQIPDHFLASLSIPDRTQFWQQILVDPNVLSTTFVAVVNGTIVGFASAGPCRDDDMPTGTGELYAIYVSPEAMGKGAGAALHAASLDYLRELGSLQATLWVLSSNDKSRAWYERKGWAIEGRSKTDTVRDVELHELRYIIEL